MDMQTFPEVVQEAVGAAVLAIAHEEERIAHEALATTDPRCWSTLEWIVEPVRFDCAGVWPRAIACRWSP